MTLGLAERQGRLGNVAVARCEAELPERSIYRLLHVLHAERDRLFPDELFADLYGQHGRRSVPPSILAVVMVLQRLEGCSDREAVDRFAYDLRWRYAAGVDDEVSGFAHTVLVELRARLRRSTDPVRIFRVTTQLARQLGLVGVRRAPPMAGMQPWRRRCWPTCPRPVPPASLPSRRPPASTPRPCRPPTATAPTAPARCWRTWMGAASPR